MTEHIRVKVELKADESVEESPSASLPAPTAAATEQSPLAAMCAVPVMQRYRHTAAAVWFFMLAFFSAFLPLATMNLWPPALMLGLCAGCSAFISGATIGSTILDPNVTKSAFGAAVRGVVVVLLSHMLLPLFIVLFGGFGPDPSASLQTPIQLVYAAIISLMYGIVTIPLGWMGAWQLYKVRNITRNPTGCRLHGYGKKQSSAE